MGQFIFKWVVIFKVRFLPKLIMETLFDIGMATGPVIGYVHQYFIIKRDKSLGTFSVELCGILLFANILRLNFFIFTRYEIALFFQSLIMVAAQICLIHICTKYAHKKTQVTLQSNNHAYDDSSKQQKFWHWNKFSTYICCIAVFAFTTLSLSIFFKKLEFEAYGVFIGLVALLSESLLIMPQILQNYRSKSTKGLSRVLVVLNLSGDVTKLIYFLIKSQAFQFVMCGVIQVVLDSYVVVQIVYYNGLEQEKFERENKSLVIEKKSSPQAESANALDEIEMNKMEQISPDAQDGLDLESGYASKVDNQLENDSPENEDKVQLNNADYLQYQDQELVDVDNEQIERENEGIDTKAQIQSNIQAFEIV